MARDLDTGMDVALIADTVVPILLVDIEFESGNVYVWSGMGDFLWNSITWKGVGDLGRISPIEETQDLRATGIVVELAGVDTSLIASAIGDARQGKPAEVYLGLLDPTADVLDETALVAEPQLAFGGKVDVPSVHEAGETSVIRIQIENNLIDLESPKLRRYTHEDQKLDHPTDKGLEFITGGLRRRNPPFGGRLAWADKEDRWNTLGGFGSGG